MQHLQGFVLSIVVTVGAWHATPASSQDVHVMYAENKRFTVHDNPLLNYLLTLQHLPSFDSRASFAYGFSTKWMVDDDNKLWLTGFEAHKDRRPVEIDEIFPGWELPKEATWVTGQFQLSSEKASGRNDSGCPVYDIVEIVDVKRGVVIHRQTLRNSTLPQSTYFLGVYFTKVLGVSLTYDELKQLAGKWRSGDDTLELSVNDSSLHVVDRRKSILEFEYDLTATKAESLILLWRHSSLDQEKPRGVVQPSGYTLLSMNHDDGDQQIRINLSNKHSFRYMAGNDVIEAKPIFSTDRRMMWLQIDPTQKGFVHKIQDFGLTSLFRKGEAFKLIH